MYVMVTKKKEGKNQNGIVKQALSLYSTATQNYLRWVLLRPLTQRCVT